jgi:hypothetical protein
MPYQPATGGENLHLDSFGGVPVIFRDDPPNDIKVVGGQRG